MNLVYPLLFAAIGLGAGIFIGIDRTKLREVSDLVDPKNPGKIVMRSGDSFYIFPGGYEYVPKHLLIPRG